MPKIQMWLHCNFTPEKNSTYNILSGKFRFAENYLSILWLINLKLQVGVY